MTMKLHSNRKLVAMKLHSKRKLVSSRVQRRRAMALAMIAASSTFLLHTNLNDYVYLFANNNYGGGSTNSSNADAYFFLPHKSNNSKSTTVPPRPPPAGNFYTCGWDQPELGQQLFPDYNYSGILTYTNSQNSTENDILLHGMHGPCDIARDYEKHFAGKVLMLNGEPFGLMPETERQFQMGGPVVHSTSFPNSQTSHHTRVFFLTIVLAKQHYYGHDGLWGKLLDPSKRPRWDHHNASASASASAPGRLAYVSSRCKPHRQTAVQLISKILAVETGGQCTVTGARKMKVTEGSGWEDNWKLYSNYKYCLTMENSKTPGYISEKILLGFLAGCLPIYYGTEEVFDVFNADSFIYFDVRNPQPALDQIIYLESNRTAYDEMMSRPILKNGMATVDEYFSVSDTIGDGSLKRTIRAMMNERKGDLGNPKEEMIIRPTHPLPGNSKESVGASSSQRLNAAERRKAGRFISIEGNPKEGNFKEGNPEVERKEKIIIRPTHPLPSNSKGSVGASSSEIWPPEGFTQRLNARTAERRKAGKKKGRKYNPINR
jgi:hypothetical protein